MNYNFLYIKLGRIARFIEQHKVIFFCIFSLFYFLGVSGKACSKPLWFDELFSWYISDLPGIPDILKALDDGVDNNPPLIYFLIRASHFIFGTGELATRFPSILGFWLALFFLFLIISKRCGSLIAYIGVLFLCLSDTYIYAFEARPYALVLACCSASLFFWQSAVEGHLRKTSLLGMGLSLGIALALHYYAVLLFAPLIIGESYRSLRSRRMDWPVWISITAGAAVLILFAPIILRIRGEYSEFFWSKPTKEMLMESGIYFFLDPAPALFYGIGFFVGVIKNEDNLAQDNPKRSIIWDIPFHEIVASITLMSLPILCFILAKLITNAFVYRYFLSTAVGIALGLAFFYHRLLKDRLWLTTLLVVLLMSVFMVRQTVNTLRLICKNPDVLAPLLMESLSPTDDTPIVISEPLIFLQYYRYAPNNLKTRLRYLTDIVDARQLTSESAVVSLVRLREIVPLCVEDYRSFLSSHNRFYLYGPMKGSIPSLLLDHGCQLKIKNTELKFRNREERSSIFIEVFNKHP